MICPTDARAAALDYTIHPQAEPRGCGNGWHDVPELDATRYTVETAAGEPVAQFATRTEAAAYIAARSTERS